MTDTNRPEAVHDVLRDMRQWKGDYSVFADRIERALSARASAGEGGELARVGELIRTQDNRITDSPIFIVQQKRRIYGTEDGYSDNYVWIDGESTYTDDEKAARDAERAEDELPPAEYRQCGYIDIWEFVTACFTEQGCKDYLARDGHNLKEPRIYAAGSYRNEEWRTVRKFLMGLTAAPQPAQAGASGGGDWVHERANEIERNVYNMTASQVFTQMRQLLPRKTPVPTLECSICEGTGLVPRGARGGKDYCKACASAPASPTTGSFVPHEDAPAVAAAREALAPHPQQAPAQDRLRSEITREDFGPDGEPGDTNYQRWLDQARACPTPPAHGDGEAAFVAKHHGDYWTVQVLCGEEPRTYVIRKADGALFELPDDRVPFVTFPATRPTPEAREYRLFDSQWVSVVNHAGCYRDMNKEDAVAQAVKLTEQAMAANINDCKWPRPRKADAALALPAQGEG